MGDYILTPTDQRIIRCLIEHGEQPSVLQLSRILDIDPRQARQSINELERIGIVCTEWINDGAFRRRIWLATAPSSGAEVMLQCLMY